MFETSGTTEVIEKSSWPKYALSFAAGCIVTGLISYTILMPGAARAAAQAAEKAAQEKFSAELARNPLEAQLENTKATLQAAAQDRDACKAKFDRQTILYDNSITVEPDKVWIIPADVEPIAVGDHRVSYTKFDPRTQRETVRFHPSQQ